MNLLEQGAQPFDEEGIADHIQAALNIDKPSGAWMDSLYGIVKIVFDPVLIDTAKVPRHPCLFVSNHALFALDGLVLVPTVYNELGRFLRPMGDRILWNKATERIFMQQGGVLGHPDVCAALMESGADMLVYPGGTYEALKPKKEQYRLQWKQRHGFVKLAALHGYTIVPVASVGPDEFYDHLIEGEDILFSPLGKLIKQMGQLTGNTRTDIWPPVPVGAWGSLFPKPQRCYFKFGEPLDLSEHQGKQLPKKRLMAIRTQVAKQLDDMIAELLVYQAEHRSEESLWRRLLQITPIQYDRQ